MLFTISFKTLKSLISTCDLTFDRTFNQPNAHSNFEQKTSFAKAGLSMLKKNVSNGTGTNFYKDNTGSVESPGLYKPSDINESKLIKSRHDNSTQ